MINKDIQVSIIVPAYNVEKRISKCLKSILFQKTNYLFEVLVINDGSTDGTAKVISEFEDNYPNLKVIHKSNGGVSSARNLGMDNASGKWLMFVDSDDYLNEDCLEKMINQVQKDKFQLAVIGFRLNDELPKINSQKMECYEGAKEISDFLTLDQWKTKLSLIGPCGKLFRTEILRKEKIRFEESVSIAEDTIFVLNYYLKIDKIVCCYDQEYVYWRSENSLSSYGKASIEELLKARLLVLETQKKIFLKYRIYLPITYMQSKVIESAKIILLNSMYSKTPVSQIKSCLRFFLNNNLVKKSMVSVKSEKGFDKLVAYLLKKHRINCMIMMVLFGKAWKQVTN